MLIGSLNVLFPAPMEYGAPEAMFGDIEKVAPVTVVGSTESENVTSIKPCEMLTPVAPFAGFLVKAKTLGCDAATPESESIVVKELEYTELRALGVVSFEVMPVLTVTVYVVLFARVATGCRCIIVSPSEGAGEKLYATGVPPCVREIFPLKVEALMPFENTIVISVFLEMFVEPFSGYIACTVRSSVPGDVFT